MTRPPDSPPPPGWRDQPFTPATITLTVSLIRQAYGAAKAAAFKAWLTRAIAADPALTPNQAVAAWLAGTAVSGGTAAAGSVLGQLPGAAAKGAENAVSHLPSISNPLDFLRNIAAFFDRLGQASTWLRIGEFLLGAGLIIAGVAKLASGTAAGKAAAKIVKAVPV